MTLAIFAGKSIDTAISTDTNSGLQMSDSDFGSFSKTKFAVSLWFYRNSAVINNHNLMWLGQDSGGSNSGTTFILKFGANVAPLEFIGYNGASFVAEVNTLTTFAKDEQAWHHLLLHYDSANATEANRVKIWIDGASDIEASPTYPAQSVALNTQSGKTSVGAGTSTGGGLNDPFGGDMYQVAIFDNYLPDISEVYNSGVQSIYSVPNKHFFLPFDGVDLTKDAVLATNWTNVGAVTKTTNRPS